MSQGGEPPSAESSPGATARHIRGSTLLLAGRLVALVVGLVTEVILVRYLSKADYGAFAWALSIVSLSATVSVFGLDKAVGRFVAIYQERGETERVAGVIVLMIGIVLLVGAAAVLTIHVLDDLLSASALADEIAVSLLGVMILLAPLRALDSLSVSMMAIFSTPGAIFLRRYVIAPGLEFAIVMVVVLLGAGIVTVGVGYVVAAVLGLAFSGAVLLRAFARNRIFVGREVRGLRPPVREVLGFATPLLSSDFVYVLRGSALVIMLEGIRGITEVADFRAVMPIARHNLIVLQTFTVLFTPIAARFIARGEREDLNTLYWRSAAWIALVTLPLFLASFSLAGPVTVFLFGERYAEAGVILAILATGYYVSAALGFNSITLRVAGVVRYVVVADVVTILIGLPLGFALISLFGAVGAAISLSATLILQNLIYHAGLRRAAGLELLPRRQVRVYLSIIAAAAVVLIVQLTLDPPLVAGLSVAAMIAGIVTYLNREVLQVAEVFPELAKLPLIGRILR